MYACIRCTSSDQEFTRLQSIAEVHKIPKVGTAILYREFDMSDLYSANL